MEASDLLSLVLDTEELCRDYAPLFLAHELTSPEVLADVTLDMLVSIGITNRHHAQHIIATRDRVFGQKTAKPLTAETRQERNREREEVPITLAMLTRCSPASQKALTKVTAVELRTLTHLVLSGKGISKIESLQHCPQAQHLYLYENRISVIENLELLTRLKVLYLQSNRIRRVEGLQALTALVRLDLSDNEIEVLEGLEMLSQLQELSCNRQRISTNFTLTEESIVGISRSLVKLSIVGCGLQDVSLLWYLDSVEEVDLSENEVEFTGGLDKMLTCMRSLQRLMLKANPVTRVAKYRDEIVMRNTSLQELDGKDILANEREYLFRLKHHKTKPDPTPAPPRKYQPLPVRFKGAGKPKVSALKPVLEVTGRKPAS